MNTNSTQETEYRRCPVHADKGAMTLAQVEAHELLAHGGRAITVRAEAPAADDLDFGPVSDPFE